MRTLWDLVEKTTENVVNTDSILEHIFKYSNPSGPGLLPGGEILPDEAEYAQDEGIMWMPGAGDILGTPPGALDEEEKQWTVEEILNELRKLKSDAGSINLPRIESVLNYQDTLSIIDPLMNKLVVSTDIDQPVLYQVCRCLLMKTRHRAVAKICIGIMGLFDIPEDKNLFKTLARHEEFTLYCSVAVISGYKDADEDWLEMAENVSGWGRIHLVNRLASSKNKKTLDWLLKEGCRNTISEEHTALIIAEAVQLHTVLSKKTVDRKTYEGAGVILRAMAEAIGSDPPFKGLELYKEGPETVKDFLRHAQKQAKTLDDFLVVAKLTEIVRPGALLTRQILNWKEEDYQEINTLGESIIRKDSWKDILEKELYSNDITERRKAVAAADSLGLDIEDKLMRLLSEKPVDVPLWHLMINRADRTMAEELIFLALEKFSSKEGKSQSVANSSIRVFDPMPSILSLLLDMLYRYPGLGGDFIEFALHNGDAETRLRAFKVLNVWETDMTYGKLAQAVWECLADTDEMVGISGEHLIKKWS